VTWIRADARESAPQVMKCAQDFMPAVDTAKILQESEAKLLSAATTPAEKKDAEAIVAKVRFCLLPLRFTRARVECVAAVYNAWTAGR
jgi:hypothetical protein